MNLETIIQVLNILIFNAFGLALGVVVVLSWFLFFIKKML